MPDVTAPAGYTVDQDPSMGPIKPPPGYTVDANSSMAPNQTNPQADTTKGQALGSGSQSIIPASAFGLAALPQTALPPGAGSPTRGNFVQHVDPATLQMGTRLSMQGMKPPVEEIWGTVFNGADRKASRNERLFQGPNGQYYDHKGDWVDSDLVDKSSLRAPGASLRAPEREEIEDPRYGHVTRFWNASNNKWEVEEDQATGLPVRRYNVGSDPFNKQLQIQAQIGNQIYMIDKGVRDRLSKYLEENTVIDPLTQQKKLDEAGFYRLKNDLETRAEKQKKDIVDRATKLSGYIDMRANPAPPVSATPPTDQPAQSTPPASHGNVKTGGTSTFGNWAH